VDAKPGLDEVFTKKEEAAIIAIARTAAATPYFMVRALIDMFEGGFVCNWVNPTVLKSQP
jgi:hypothetical protein